VIVVIMILSLRGSKAAPRYDFCPYVIRVGVITSFHRVIQSEPGSQRRK